MKMFRLLILLICCITAAAGAQVTITKSATGWELNNGHIRLELTRSSDTVRLKSLRRSGGSEWAVEDSPLIASPEKAGKDYRYWEDAISDLEKGGKQLTLRFQSDHSSVLSLQLKLYPKGAVIQTAMRIETMASATWRLIPA